MLPRPALTFAFAVLLCSTAAAAQTPSSAELRPGDQIAQYDTPAYVAAVDGTATLERDGRVEPSPLNMPLLSGDRLRTSDGRVEVRFADGGRLFVDVRTTIDVMSDDLVRLVDGRLRVMEARTQRVNYRIDSTAGSARLLQPGDYRVALLRDERETQLELAVIRGAGEIFTELGTTPVRAGERAYASAGLAPSYAYAYNSANADDFDRWAERQRGAVYVARDSRSAGYLPQDMGAYSSTFDEYGDWRYQQDYGYVWYPRVAADWRPYYYGRWAPYPTYGWTWIPADPFGYPTHHYGRWGFSAGLWFWIPSRHWGPAYVSWGYANDYVSWCPLGWNNRAVFSINIFNVGPGYYSAAPYYYSAWTVVPRGRFGRGYAYRDAVRWDRGYTGPRPRWTEGRAPAYDVAVPRRSTDAHGIPSSVEERGTAPVRYAGTRAAPAPVGAESPRYVNRGNEIVRSQSERPSAPRDVAVPRRAESPSASPERRQPYAWDSPSYRPPAAASPGYDRAVPRSEAPGPYRSYDRPMPRTEAPRVDMPRVDTPRAPARQAAPRDDRPGVDYARPRYEAPAANRPPEAAPPPAPAPRGYERPSGGYGRPAPSAPPARSYEPPAPRSDGGDRAVPRSGGGAPAQAAPRGEARGGRGGR